MNYVEVNGSDDAHEIILYSLTTCPHCTSAKQYLKEKGLAFKYINVDKATRDEKREVSRLLKANNLPIAFPVLIIDEDVIQGFDPELIEESLMCET